MTDPRYYGDYYQRCLEAHQSTGQRCVVCLKKSTHIHHSSYGYDVVGYSIFPVCKKCHKQVCHDPKNWIHHSNKMLSINTIEFSQWLRMRYLFAKIVHVPIHGKLIYKKK